MGATGGGAGLLEDAAADAEAGTSGALVRGGMTGGAFLGGKLGGALSTLITDGRVVE